MGCTQSKIENEETVTRCKERKQRMKEAVGARNAFAAAHFAYAMSLKNTGAALSDYAQGEVQYPSSAAGGGGGLVSSSTSSSAALLQPGYEPFIAPPPPLPPQYTPAPLQRANTAPEMSFPKTDLKSSDTIMEDENEGDGESESVHGLKHRNSKSSGGGGGGGIYRQRAVEDEVLQRPPSPPSTPPQNNSVTQPPTSSENKGMMYWEFFTNDVLTPTLAEVDENRMEREEMGRKMMEEERAKRSEVDGGGGGRRSTGKAEVQMEADEVVEKVAELPPQPPQPPATTKALKKVKVVPAEGKRKAVSTMNFLELFGQLDDCFLKASESAHEVSKMLEANRLHYHSNFADNRGHIDHSARVMRVITWNRSFRGLQNADDPNDDFDSEERETHATVLDKMLAWEKKLYDEVKAAEQMKLEYQKKVASLNKLKKRESNTEALERMKAAVSHLHTRYIVDMQSMDSTVSEINRLRDEQLYPKLVALVDGMATMWENMREHHQNQLKIVRALDSLDISQCAKETSEHHHGRTYQLREVVKEWHSQCEKLMTHQKQYIAALNSWLKLNLIPIDTNLREKVSSPQRPQNPPIQSLLHEWHDSLDKLPDEIARSAIFNFSAVVDAIMQYQVDEIKMRDRCEETQKELMRKKRQFDDWYNKYMQRRTPPDEMDPERAADDDLIAERKLQYEVVEKRLEEEKEMYEEQCIQVRQKSLTSLKQRLPEIFRAMTQFSIACSDMYSNLRVISQTHNRNENL